jgi:hypothetical protein
MPGTLAPELNALVDSGDLKERRVLQILECGVYQVHDLRMCGHSRSQSRGGDHDPILCLWRPIALGRMSRQGRWYRRAMPTLSGNHSNNSNNTVGGVKPNPVSVQVATATHRRPRRGAVLVVLVVRCSSTFERCDIGKLQ